jgi:protein-glutamine gamma-glutamyltransferase
MARTLAACLLPALAVTVSWLRLEEPSRAGEALVVVALAIAPALAPRRWMRWLAATAAAACVAWIAFEAEPWEMLPFRDERYFGPLGEWIGVGVADFYRVLLPFDAGGSPAMHGLVLAAIFGFVLATALLVAASRPVAAAAVAVGGAGWPATLIGGDTVALGALALAAALSIPLLSRVRSGPSLVAGTVAAAVVVAGAAWASSATTVAREAVLNWESWDLQGVAPRAPGVRFAWDANYEGLEFPPTKTVVLKVEGPDSARYWRASTLDLFHEDHWIEDLSWVGRVDGESGAMARDPLTPAKALREANWLEQRIEVRALVDDRLAAAGTPVALDSRGLGIVVRWSGGVLRVLAPLEVGQRYRVWSYAPDPAPATLAASRPRYPAAAETYQTLGSRAFPDFGAPGRESEVHALLADPSYDSYFPYRSLYTAARRVARDAKTPYETVLALESWFRTRGGFRYDESPPQVSGPPLVGFVTNTKAGYCQHYAGAMAVMLRLLGIPARVAVGFGSGKFVDGKWIVTDHDAHAWVEVWFRGHGWVPFDPTPGRFTSGGNYSYASESEEAIAALDRGDLSQLRVDRLRPDSADIIRDGAAARDDGPPSLFGLALGGGALWVLVVGLGKALYRRLRYVTGDPRAVATASRHELEAFLRDQGIAVSSTATLEDLRRLVGEELGLDCRMFADAAARARFGPPDESRRAADTARKELKALLRRLRFELSVWSRFRGLVSLRSLRKGWQS